jgi:FMN phosphatase YigB (HAD superfamily)
MIFELAVKMAKVRPEESVFVDDSPDYLNGAFKAGFIYLFQSTAQNQYKIFEQATEIKDLIELKNYL